MSSNKKDPKRKSDYKRGTTHIKIDWKKVEALLEAENSGAEIASILGISVDTLYNHCFYEHDINWSEYKQKGRNKGRGLMKYDQYKAARNGDTKMMIFWGKNYLGQREKFDHDIQGQININHIHYNDDEEQKKWEQNNSCEFTSRED